VSQFTFAGRALINTDRCPGAQGIRLTNRLRLLLIALLLPAPVFAHSDAGPPLYVAEGGRDAGDCTDAGAPCRTLSYTLDRVGKGGEIRVAGGRYSLAAAEDLFHVVSGIVTVRGGFSRDDAYNTPSVATTTLVGVPPEYRALFTSKGFHVLADTKSLPDADAGSDAVADETRRLMKLHESLEKSLGGAPCSNGQSGGLSCSNVELLSHIARSEVSARPDAASDVWGFVDMNTGREYAVVGFNTGTGVFDITDPSLPREIGFIDGLNTTWRDVKIYQYFDAPTDRWKAHAYITTDGAADGLFVIDLTGLPQRIGRLGYDSDFSAAHNVFAADTDYATGLSRTGRTPSLVIAGSNNGGGRFRSYRLDNPAAPQFVDMPAPGAGDYMHDAATMIIRDARKDTQCVNATDYCEVLFDFNESTVDIWDVTNPAAAVRLSRTPYPNARYTHSGWPSEDGMYLYVHDELDERDFGLATTVRVFSLANLASPSVAGQWNGPTNAIDHNGFVRGNRYYMSNYSRGLTVLDLSDPGNPVTVGSLDTYPFSDSSGFVGAWGVYPYFPSGTIAISDIAGGLFLAGDDTLDVAAGSLSFVTTSYAGTEGSSVDVTVRRSGGAAGAVGVAFELVPGTSSADDYAALPATLSWADGDAADKTLSIPLLADGIDEPMEQALVRLVAPTGGATLAPRNIASVFLEDPGAGTEIDFDAPLVQAPERGFATAVVVLRRRGSAAGAATVDYSLAGGDATAGADFSGVTSGTVSWPDGDATPRWLEFSIADDGVVEDDEYFELALSAPTGALLGPNTTVRVELLDGDGANAAPNAIVPASQQVAPGALVVLDGTASADPDGDTLEYAWTQTMGPAVTLSGASSAEATFTAPAASSNTLLRFQLAVTDPRGLSDTATTNVTVGTTSGIGGGGGGGGGPATWLLALLAAACLARRRLSRTDGV